MSVYETQRLFQVVEIAQSVRYSPRKHKDLISTLEHNQERQAWWVMSGSHYREGGNRQHPGASGQIIFPVKKFHANETHHLKERKGRWYLIKPKTAL